MIPVPNEAIIKPKELSVKPRPTVKKVWPRIEREPAANQRKEIDTVIFRIS